MEAFRKFKAVGAAHRYRQLRYRRRSFRRVSGKLERDLGLTLTGACFMICASMQRATRSRSSFSTKPGFRDAKIIVADVNWGCGSSREACGRCAGCERDSLSHRAELW